MNTGKTIGLILVVVGLGVCLLSALWVGVNFANSESDLELTGAVLGQIMIL